jgi:hypothetical protein
MIAPSPPPFRWTAQRERAALLLAEDDRSDTDIAADLGVSFVTLWRWRQHPDFAGKVGDHMGRIRAAMLRHAIATKDAARASQRQLYKAF